MTGEAADDVTGLLRAWRQGDEVAGERLLPKVYGDLKERAARYLAGERRDHSLEVTALVHETYLRLVDYCCLDWRDRSHFLALAAQQMRRILIDHARRRHAQKRGSAPLRVTFGDWQPLATSQDIEALDEALRALAEFDAVKARLVELRFFAGCTVEETAEILGCSAPTVTRQWRAARAWLLRELAGEPEPS
ncbi:MAG: ECF-type sigma factor [Acidobacteriota bacterium]